MASSVVWNETTAQGIKLALAAGALVVIAWHEWKRRGGHRQARVGGAVREKLIRALGVVSLVAYFNFGWFHFNGIFVHLWDATHYVLGAKYFDEIGYDGLYNCIAVADAEQAADPEGISLRRMRDLRTNRMTTAADAIAHPERCVQRFTAARWTDFTSDVALFRNRFPIEDWERLPTDHGFNASPVWTLVAHPLVGHEPLTWRRVQILAAIDPVILIAAFGVLLWAFGATTTAVAAIALGTYFPARLWWTGGSFLRWDWLAALLAGLALCRRDRPTTGGVLIGYATAVKIFPGFSLLGACLGVAVAFVGRKPVAPAAVRLLAGAFVTIVVLGAIAGVARGDGAWFYFAGRLGEHAAVPSPNRMGLGAVLAFQPGLGHSALLEGDDADGHTRWENAHAGVLAGRKPLWWIAAAIGVLAIARATRGEPVWATCVLGLLLVPLGTPIACYYYAFVAALPLLVERRRELGGIVVALTLAAGGAALLSRYDMGEQYVAQSLLVLLAFTFFASSFLARRPGDQTAGIA